MWSRTGFPRTLIIGLGTSAVSSRMRVPRPAASRTALSILVITNCAGGSSAPSLDVKATRQSRNYLASHAERPIHLCIEIFAPLAQSRAHGGIAVSWQISRDGPLVNSRQSRANLHRLNRAGTMEPGQLGTCRLGHATSRFSFPFQILVCSLRRTC